MVCSVYIQPEIKVRGSIICTVNLPFCLLITCKHMNFRKEEGVETYLISDQNGLCGFEGCAMATFQLPTVVDLVRFCCIYSICICGPLKKGVAKEEVNICTRPRPRIIYSCSLICYYRLAI